MDTNRILIAGGGIAGLAAAYYAAKSAPQGTTITLLEAGPAWGGKIVTDRESGFVIEGGPDTFIVTKPWAVNLCRALGIADRLQGTNPETKKTYILKKGALHELPGGLTMMIPTEIGEMVRTGLLSWPEKARMGLDFLLPPKNGTGDESLGAFVTRRLGRGAYESLIEPLMSGIYAGDGDHLSLAATFPYLRDLEKKHGGLVRGALAARRERAKGGGPAAPGSRSLFLTPLTGLTELVEALVGALEQMDVDLRLEAPVVEIDRHDSWRLTLEDGQMFESEALILATPAFVSSDLLKGYAPLLAEELRAIEYVSTATVSLAYREAGLPRPLDGYGYVIPRREGRAALACTWTSTKFPHRAPEGCALLRVFVGRAGQEGEIPWDEAGLLEIAREELRQTLGISAEPLFTRTYIWENAMPQYNLGHPERLDRIDAALESLPGLSLAGAGYRGIGIPDCIRSGELAAGRAVRQINTKETASA
ncbi:MAG TPA: protoporphyrinogen oxidase [Anaerolineales bacterium]|nr:protoporphyrinogen oxidase [Anaerolineales bacterium]